MYETMFFEYEQKLASYMGAESIRIGMPDERLGLGLVSFSVIHARAPRVDEAIERIVGYHRAVGYEDEGASQEYDHIFSAIDIETTPHLIGMKVIRSNEGEYSPFNRHLVDVSFEFSPLEDAINRLASSAELSITYPE